MEGFSSDRLFRLLNAVGHEVEIVIRQTINRSNPPVSGSRNGLSLVAGMAIQA